MSLINLNPIHGIYPFDIQESSGLFRVEETEVLPVPEEEEIKISLEKSKETFTLGEVCLKIIKLVLYYLFFPITYPITLLSEFLLRITVFPMILHHSDFGLWAIKTFTSTPIDLARIEEGKKSIVAMGGEAIKVITDDLQEIEVVRVTQEAFHKKIEELGGIFVSYQVALDPHDAKHYLASHTGDSTHTLSTIEFRESESAVQTLKKFGLQEITVETQEGSKKVFQFSLRLGLDPVPKGDREVVIRFHPYVHHYPYEKKYLLNHLAMGKDVVFFDTRGLSKTTFAPSEEGLYMDADAVYRQVRDEWGYQGKNIWLTARCSGTSQATYLRHRYQDDGLNLVLENPFERFADIIQRQFWPLNWMGMSVMSSLESTDPETIVMASRSINRYVDQFDNIRKLAAMPRKPLDGSRVIVISTDTDQLIGTDAAPSVALTAARTAKVFHLKHQGKDPQKDGHFEDVFLTDPNLYSAYSQLMTSNQAQYLSNYR